MGSSLESSGTDISGPLWSAKCLATAPSAIAQVTHNFLAAGADIVSTATYQASHDGFSSEIFVTADDAEALMQSAIAIACDERDTFWSGLSEEERENRRTPLVALSLGPYGAYCADSSEYTGLYDASNTEVLNFHKRRSHVLVSRADPAKGDPCADLVLFETIPVIHEAVGIVSMMESDPSFELVSFLVSFQCRSSLCLASGEHLSEAVDSILAANKNNHGLVAIGVNCVNPEYAVSLCGVIRSRVEEHMLSIADSSSRWEIAVLASPNSGEAWSDGEWLDNNVSSNPADWARRLSAADADIVGGCCRCGPNHVRANKEV